MMSTGGSHITICGKKKPEFSGDRYQKQSFVQLHQLCVHKFLALFYKAQVLNMQQNSLYLN